MGDRIGGRWASPWCPALGPGLLLLAACAGERPAPQVIELEPYVGRLRKVEVTVDGRPYDFLFDSGGGFTSLVPELAERVGCEPHGRLVGFRMDGERVESRQCGRVEIAVGELPLTMEVDLFDLMALLPAELPPLHGIVSLHTFQDQAVTLDLAADRLVVETEASLAQRVREMQPLAVSLNRELEGRGLTAFARVEAARGYLLLLLDSANLAGVRLAPTAWRQLQPGAEPPPPGKSAPVVLDFGPAGRRRVTAQAADLIHDGALDAAFMESALLTLDLPRGRAWIRFHDEGTGTPP